ncbi:uncharacterized protein ccdc175 [Odontesthes bonariensis]|uniref:uncharacterized protein ccdc175 n=1 Tax=Odontesthes bonariensis TaxID=219752 RepID=UPI003F58274E
MNGGNYMNINVVDTLSSLKKREIKMASCLVPDFPAVLMALEHLKDLDKQLREEGVPFAQEASIHLTEITAAVTDLEAERRTAHEHLEVETIENSKLRHQFNNIRERMSEGIMADVAAVRASNAEEIEQLRKDISTASQLQEETVEKLEALLSQNKILFPEREQVKAENDAIVATLNDQLTLRYSSQMQLDQTRDLIEELKSSIAAVEQNKISLQQNRILEREAFSENKDSLSREVDQTEEEVLQQEQAILSTRKELEIVDDKREETHSHLAEISFHTGKMESNVRGLTASRCQCEQLLEDEILKHGELRQQREMLKKELHELREAFHLTVGNIQDQIATMEAKIEEVRASKPLILDAMSQICKIFTHRHDEENEVRAEHLHVTQQLRQSRLQLEERIASIVKHGKEAKEMDKQIKELQEADAINRRVFKRNQEEACGDLEAEKNNVGHFEEKKRRLGQLLEEERRTQEEHVAKMTSEINNTRRRYEELLQEEAALHQRQPKSADADVLMSHVTQSEAEYKQMESIQRQEVQQCSAEAESIGKSTEEKQREVQEEEELLKEVEAKWDEEQSRHERLEALTHELKRKRMELNLSIEGKKLQTSSLLLPREAMKAQLEELQSCCIRMLDQQASELTAVEVNVYNDSVKLEQVGVENSRLRLGIRQMTEDINTTGQLRDRHRREIQQLSHNTQALSESLQEAWRGDASVTRACQSRDGALLASMGSLLDRLKTRKQQLVNVSALLHRQMLDFSKRLGDKTAVEEPSRQPSLHAVTSVEPSLPAEVR